MRRRKERGYIRAQVVVCGRDLASAGYFDLDLYPVTTAQHRARPRAKRRLASSVGQQKRNERHSRRYLVRLLITNFLRVGDAYHVTLCFDDAHLPASGEGADALMMAWWRKVKARCRWRGLEEPIMVGVTEWQEPGPGRRAVRPHCHVVLRCGLSREELELLWNTGGPHCGARASLEELREHAELLGRYTNADALREDRGSFEALAEYITKAPRRRHRWHRSRGLREPILPRPNDTRYTRRKLAALIREHLDDRAYWRAVYPGWELRAAQAEHNEFTGWTLRLQFYKPERPPRPGGKETPVPREGGAVLDEVLCALCGVDPATGEVRT